MPATVTRRRSTVLIRRLFLLPLIPSRTHACASRSRRRPPDRSCQVKGQGHYRAPARAGITDPARVRAHARRSSARGSASHQVDMDGRGINAQQERVAEWRIQ
ncbi:hypothetical protein C8Q77DRAFT_1142204 [Trametes polyzona]|nr:hypothetical protein C8Q77DRAFT_1142204 [Trametes polyzona]